MAEVRGAVELLQRDRIVGWAIDPENAPALIDVALEGRVIKRLKALWPRGGVQSGFRFRIHRSLLAYIPSTASLTFQVSGETLPVVDNKLELAPPKRRRPPQELFDKLDSGWIITKKGRAIMSPHLNEAWQHGVIAWYSKAREIFRQLFGYDLHIAAGTLLGSTRDDAVIAGDDDFDTAYLSRFSDPVQIRDEMVFIMTALIRHGQRVRIGRRRNLFHWVSPEGIEIDVFPGWTDGRRYYMTFAIGTNCGAEMREGFVERPFLGGTVLAPKRDEAVLAGCYGRDWRTPDPNWQWAVSRHTRQVMAKVKMTDEQIERVRATRLEVAQTSNVSSGA